MENETPHRTMPDPSAIPLHALRITSRSLISSLLNPQKVIPNDSGLPRDWRGLAHLIGFKAEQIPVFAYDNDPTAKILHLWQKQNNPPCTIEQLRLFLGQLDRYDIVDDTQYSIDCDMLNFMVEPEPTTTIVSPMFDSDRDIITRDDINGVIQNYDAFVVFADEDIDFATELIDIMEKQYGFKLCVKERDLVAGLHYEHSAIIKLIANRCNRLIVIISPAYLRSSANKFVVNYAQAFGIEYGVRKIIPCLYEECDIPYELQHMFLLNYTRSGKLFNFWEKLRDSLQTTPKNPSHRLNTPQSVSQGIKANHSENLPDLKPALVNSNKNNLKPKKNGVKFGSCQNLTIPELNETKRSVSVNTINAESTSSNSNTDPIPVQSSDTKSKKKFNFIKKIIHYTKKEKKSSDCNDKDKKKNFFPRKKKVPVLN